MAEQTSLIQIIKHLKSLENPHNIAGMARFGINPENTLGISVATLRKLAREIGKSHELALELWESGIHEARILATLVDIPNAVTEAQMEKWVNDFNSWDVCDQCCSNLFSRTGLAYQKVGEWCCAEREYVKRAGFVMIAALTVKDKKAADRDLELFLKQIAEGSTDGRNFVKKAVNWALRQIGKRNLRLNKKAIEAARKIQQIDSSSSRWVAADALRELTDPALQARLAGRR